jgi:hypothetical protein
MVDEDSYEKKFKMPDGKKRNKGHEISLEAVMT